MLPLIREQRLVVVQAGKGSRDDSVLASSGGLTTGIDASRTPVDDDRPSATDLSAEQDPATPRAPAEMRAPTATERLEAYQRARIAADRADAKLIGEEISRGHAFDKHVIERREFPGVTTRRQFADMIEGIVLNGEPRALGGRRTAYWDHGMLVIRNPGAPDGGTAFRPTNGYDYFLGLH